MPETADPGLDMGVGHGRAMVAPRPRRRSVGSPPRGSPAAAASRAGRASCSPAAWPRPSGMTTSRPCARIASRHPAHRSCWAESVTVATPAHPDIAPERDLAAECPGVPRDLRRAANRGAACGGGVAGRRGHRRLGGRRRVAGVGLRAPAPIPPGTGPAVEPTHKPQARVLAARQGPGRCAPPRRLPRDPARRPEPCLDQSGLPALQPRRGAAEAVSPSTAARTLGCSPDGADPNVRASLRPRLRFTDNETRHAYRDVAPLAWGRRFHGREGVNPAAMAAVETADPGREDPRRACAARGVGWRRRAPGRLAGGVATADRPPPPPGRPTRRSACASGRRRSPVPSTR